MRAWIPVALTALSLTLAAPADAETAAQPATPAAPSSSASPAPPVAVTIVAPAQAPQAEGSAMAEAMARRINEAIASAPIAIGPLAEAAVREGVGRMVAREMLDGRLSQVPVVADEAATSTEFLAWRDYLREKFDRRMPRNEEIGGRAALGVRLGSPGQLDEEVVPAAVLQSLSTWNQEGALVTSIVPGSPAEQAGMLAGDVVVQFAGIWVDSSALLVRLASRAQVDREVEVWVLRGGEIERLFVTPADRSVLGN